MTVTAPTQRTQRTAWTVSGGNYGFAEVVSSMCIALRTVPPSCAMRWHPGTAAAAAAAVGGCGERRAFTRASHVLFECWYGMYHGANCVLLRVSTKQRASPGEQATAACASWRSYTPCGASLPQPSGHVTQLMCAHFEQGRAVVATRGQTCTQALRS